MSTINITKTERALIAVSAELRGLTETADRLRMHRIDLVYRLLDAGLTTDAVAALAGTSQPRIVQINNKRREVAAA